MGKSFTCFGRRFVLPVVHRMKKVQPLMAPQAGSKANRGHNLVGFYVATAVTFLCTFLIGYGLRHDWRVSSWQQAVKKANPETFNLQLPQKATFFAIQTDYDPTTIRNGTDQGNWQQVLGKVALPDGTVIVLGLTTTHDEILELWLARLSQGEGTLQYLPKILVISPSTKHHRLCLRHNLNCYLDDRSSAVIKPNSSSRAMTLLSTSFHLGFYKVELMKSVLQEGYNVLYVDPDVIWLKDPMPYLRKDMDINAACHLYHSSPFWGVNTGFMWMQSSKRALMFVDHWVKAHETRYPDLHDHDVFNKVRPDQDELVRHKIGLKVHYLDPQVAATVCGVHGDAVLTQTAMLSANCEAGIGRKVDRLKGALKRRDEALSSNNRTDMLQHADVAAWRDILRQVALSDNTVIMMPFTAGFKDLLDLWVENMHSGEGTKKYLKHVLVISPNANSHSVCQQHELVCWLDTSWAANGTVGNRDYLAYKSQAYSKMVFHKVELIKAILLEGYNVLFTDADVIWLKDPVPYLKKEFDVCTSCDHYLKDTNTGFMWIKNSNRAVQFMDYWYKDHETRFPKMLGQEVMMEIRPDRDPFVRDVLGMTLGYLDTRYMGTFCQVHRDKLHDLVTLHANCETSRIRKMTRLRTLLARRKLGGGRRLPHRGMSSIDGGPLDDQGQEPSRVRRMKVAAWQQALRHVALPDQTVILMPITSAFNDLLDLWVENMRDGEGTDQYLQRVLIAAHDLSSYAACIHHRLRCWLDTILPSKPFVGNDKNADDRLPDYIQVESRNLELVQAVLDEGYNVLFTEADVIWLKDPFLYLTSKRGVDIAIACDSYPQHTNSAFMFLRKNNRTELFMEYWLKDNKTGDSNNPEQGGVILPRPISAMESDPHVKNVIGLTWGALETRVIGTLCQLHNDKLPDLVTLHANCQIGLDAKIGHLTEVLRMRKEAMATAVAALRKNAAAEAG